MRTPPSQRHDWQICTATASFVLFKLPETSAPYPEEALARLNGYIRLWYKNFGMFATR